MEIERSERRLCFHRCVSLTLFNEGGGETPNASWDRSHGHKGVGGGGPAPGGRHPLQEITNPPTPEVSPKEVTHPINFYPPLQEDREPGNTVNERAVYILLECILVHNVNKFECLVYSRFIFLLYSNFLCLSLFNTQLVGAKVAYF